MRKGGRLRCKNSGAVERQPGRQPAPCSKERRSFLCSAATAGAGLAGSAILSLNTEAQRKPEASPKAFATTSDGNSRVIASDKTVAGTAAGKIRGFRAERRVHFQKRAPWCFHSWPNALHASGESRALDRNSQRAAIWSCLS